MTMMIQTYRFIGVLLFLSFARAARKWSPEDYPNPQSDVKSCGRRGVSSWVCDPDGVITYNSANVVEGLIKKIYAGEPPYALGPCGSLGLKGYQVSVALMYQMSYEGEASVAAGQFAKSLHDRWGVGDAHCNNGVVLLLSIDDRQIFISAGSGTSRLLTYNVLGDIINDVRPTLKDHRYDEAVERAVVDIGLALAGRAVEPEGGKTRWWEELLGLGIFGGVVGAIIFFATRTESRKRKRYQDCKSKLEKLKRDQAAVRSSTYNPTSCPVCLEDFTDVTQTAANGTPRGEGVEGSSGAAATSIATATATDATLREEEEEEIKKPLLGKVSGCAEGLCKAATPGAGVASACPGTEAPSAPPLSSQPGAMGVGVGSQQQQQQTKPPPQQQQRRPLVLPCGHAFCESCITQWLEQKKVTCPICRKPFDDDDSPSPTSSDPRDTTNTTTNLPRPPRPTDNSSNRSPNASSIPGTGAGPSTPFGISRPPCSIDDEEMYGSQMFGNGGMAMGGTVPRLRLRWAGRRRPVRMHEDLLMAEMLFRLRQLQIQHPDYISAHMLHSWEQDLQNGRELNAQQIRQFQLNDPATRRELDYSGSTGTGVRFGGGSSRGGGGRSGSW